MEEKTEIRSKEDVIRGAEEPKVRKAARGDEWMRLGLRLRCRPLLRGEIPARAQLV